MRINIIDKKKEHLKQEDNKKNQKKQYDNLDDDLKEQLRKYE